MHVEVNEWMTQWLTQWMNEWMTQWLTQWLGLKGIRVLRSAFRLKCCM